MKTIWKFTLNSKLLPVNIPSDAIILCVHTQGDDICLWAEVTPSNASESRYFEVFDTGHNIPDTQRKYLGTAFFNNGLVFHVYERL